MMKNENTLCKYDWETSAPPLKCPSCGETAMPLSGAKTYECYGCGDRWRVGSKKHAEAQRHNAKVSEAAGRKD